jgi:hypothetical protein
MPLASLICWPVLALGKTAAAAAAAVIPLCSGVMCNMLLLMHASKPHWWLSMRAAGICSKFCACI